METGSLKLREQPHHQVTEESGGDAHHRDGEPELWRESRLTVVRDVRLLHGTAARGNPALDHWWRNAKAFTLGVALSHHRPLDAMADPIVPLGYYQLTLSK